MATRGELVAWPRRAEHSRARRKRHYRYSTDVYRAAGGAYCVSPQPFISDSISLRPARFAEEDPLILGTDTQPTEILAFCTGLLPGAAAAPARDTSELLKLGLEMVSVAFRLSFEVIRRMRLVEESSGTWATTVIGAQVESTQAILNEFHESQVCLDMLKTDIGLTVAEHPRTQESDDWRCLP